MSRRRAKGRPISGVLLLNKVAGMTSNAALQQAKRLFFAAKAGHTGSLDPLATGVLPLCFGEATKFSQYLLDADKSYRTCFCLGIATNTGDAEGEVMARHDAAAVTRSQVEEALGAFRGEILQMPPMYSALKHQGQPLYKLARQGVEVEREARRITIHRLELLDFEPGGQARVELDVDCSKGTYIRSLAEDLGQALGCGAHVASLHRRVSGGFTDSQCVGLRSLSKERGDGRAESLDHHLLPVDALVRQLPSLALPDQSSFYFRQGQPVMDPQVYRIGEEGGMVRVFSDTGDFLGVGEITDDGRVAPRRLVALPQ